MKTIALTPDKIQLLKDAQAQAQSAFTNLTTPSGPAIQGEVALENLLDAHTQLRRALALLTRAIPEQTPSGFLASLIEAQKKHGDLSDRAIRVLMKMDELANLRSPEANEPRNLCSFGNKGPLDNVSDLSKFREADLRKLPGCGRLTLKEIRDFVKKCGIII